MATAERVVIFVQENHTTDNYFGGIAPWGVNVATGWTTEKPGDHSPPHSRATYLGYLGDPATAVQTQYDTLHDLPFYAWLALNGRFFENHCSGFGAGSTPNHMLIIGGQSPILYNTSPPDPCWDMPSLPGRAEDANVPWCVYTGAPSATRAYPVDFYTQLLAFLPGSATPKIRDVTKFVTDVAATGLPRLCMVWHDSYTNEHPLHNPLKGYQAIGQCVDAIVQAGLWDTTVILLTWDDWGGWDDHVATPEVEHTSDGKKLAYGSRVPLLMFGGPVQPGIDSRWCSHVSIPKTALDLLGIGPLGVPRVDNDPGLADVVADHPVMPPPPHSGTVPAFPAAPNPARPAKNLPPPPAGPSTLVTDIVLRGNKSAPAPTDAFLTGPVVPPSVE